ncbi:MAG: HEPN domain-containing protein [Succinivibrio dextrinosolvens]|nr:HEPN domain-containing protein [Succinivibrio dextrinosolvens]
MLTKTNEYYQERKLSFDETFRTRIHRSLSWLRKADSFTEESDLDMKFICLWIAFNAAYGKSLPALDHSCSEKYAFKSFIEKIISLDSVNLLASVVCGKYAMRISFLVENKFTFHKYWDFTKGVEEASDWKRSLSASVKKYNDCRISMDVSTILSIVFDRLYVLRNQLMHGGSSCGSKLNRETIDDAVGFLSDLIPSMLLVMMMNYKKDHDWGELFYVPVKE